jgi:hypothetical protein
MYTILLLALLVVGVLSLSGECVSSMLSCLMSREVGVCEVGEVRFSWFLLILGKPMLAVRVLILWWLVLVLYLSMFFLFRFAEFVLMKLSSSGVLSLF